MHQESFDQDDQMLASDLYWAAVYDEESKEKGEVMLRSTENPFVGFAPFAGMGLSMGQEDLMGTAGCMV
ncbi:hypothetical protein Tco_1010007 [Tanacetum coccineum]